MNMNYTRAGCAGNRFDYEEEEGEILIADEAEKVQFGWNFIWKVFLATIVISLIFALLSYLVLDPAFPVIGSDHQKELMGRLRIGSQ